MSDITLLTGQRSILMTPVDINGTVINGAPPTILGTFRAINNGTGYSINDIIVLRQVGSNAPEYYNATTNAVIATPLAADLGNVSATNVTVSSALPSGSNTIGSIANTTFAATQSGTWNITNISGTVSLPTGAATSANQTTANTSLSSIDGKLPSLGQKVASGSISIIQASDAFSLPVITNKPTVTITRGANTNAYVADNVWGGRFALTLPITGDGIKSVILTRINLVTSLTSLPSGFGSFRLFLFQNTTDSANIADNNAFTRRTLAVDVDGYLLTQMQKATNDLSGRSTTFDLNVPINIDSGVTQLFGYLVTNAGYTPAAATADTITLRAHFVVA